MSKLFFFSILVLCLPLVNAGIVINTHEDLTYKLNEAFNITFISTNSTTGMRLNASTCDCKLDIYNYTLKRYITGIASYDNVNNNFYYQFIGYPEPGNYASSIWCNTSAHGALKETELQITKDGKSNQTPGPGLIAIILLPLVFSIIALFGAATLGDNHTILRVFLFLFSAVPMFASLNFGLVYVVKFYDFPEFEALIGTSSYWMGLIFGLILTYFCLYTLYKGLMSIRERKKERLEY